MKTTQTAKALAIPTLPTVNVQPPKRVFGEWSRGLGFLVALNNVIIGTSLLLLLMDHACKSTDMF
jgi:hypothetical protein